MYLKDLFPSFFEEKFFSEPIKKKPEEKITENFEELNSFFEKLQKLEKKEISKVKIIHFGDSLIWGDILTSKIKSRFQEKFGNGGIGLVPVFEYRERYFSGYKNLNKENSFQKFHLNHRQQKNKYLGFMGEGFIPFSNPFYLNVESSFDSFEIFIRNFGTHGNFTFEPNFEEQKELGYSKKFSLANTNRIQINYPTNEKFVLDGISLENKNGLVYSSVSRQGIELVDLEILGENFKSINLFQPDLLILQFGINESENIYKNNFLNFEKYKSDLEKTISFIKKNTDSKILFISPFERVYSNLKPMKEIPEMISIQKEVLNANKIPYLNLFELLGGEFQNEEMFKNKLIQFDRTHLTIEGGEKVGNLIYERIEFEYFKFIGIKEAETKKITSEKLSKAILFNSKNFFYFFILVLLLCFLFPKLKILILSFASIYFYSSYNYQTVYLLLVSIFLAYFFGILIHSINQKLKIFFLFSGIFFYLGILFYYKYYNWVFSEFKYSNIILPVGISFYSFQLISYLVDIFRRDLKPEKNFFKFLLYISFFPQLVAGPIIRAKDFLNKFKNQTHFNIKFFHFSDGIFLFSIGILKKLLADNLSISAVEKIFDSPEMFSSTEILLGIYSFTAQIYLDFSGYSDMAIGLAKILGYRLTKNFDLPYSAFTITEFWRKWHISLSNWFRDYLYIPLGGNQKNIYFNLSFVMLLCGLWHGANWTFLFWGIFHGLFLFLERFFQLRKSENLFRKFVNLNLISFAWILFRAKDLDSFLKILKNLFQSKFYFLNQEIWVFYFLILFFIYQFFGVKIFYLRKKIYRFNPILSGFIFALVIISVIYFSKLNSKAFIYFEF